MTTGDWAAVVIVMTPGILSGSLIVAITVCEIRDRRAARRAAEEEASPTPADPRPSASPVGGSGGASSSADAVHYTVISGDGFRTGVVPAGQLPPFSRQERVARGRLYPVPDLERRGTVIDITRHLERRGGGGAA